MNFSLSSTVAQLYCHHSLFIYLFIYMFCWLHLGQFLLKLYFSSVVAGISGPTKLLLEQNAQVFNQIAANLSAYKVNS